MRHPKPLPAVDYLQRLLMYDPKIKGLRWRVDRKVGRGVRIRAGARAGNDAHGYRQISIDGQLYYEHRLIWKMIHGEDPPPLIDHVQVDDLTNNHPLNLRSATKSENNFHADGLRRNNTSGITGVSWYRAENKWEAHLRVNWCKVNLGRFHCIEDAISARRAAELKYFGRYREE